MTRPPTIKHASHAGLVLTRLHMADAKDKDGTQKRATLKHAIDAQRRARDIYGKAYDRWKQAAAAAGGRTFDLKTEDRLVVGLGAGGSLETGVRLHHTYGVPVIPGSAIKGVAAHYSAAVWAGQLGKREFAAADPEKKTPAGSAYTTLFGSTVSRGCIVFEDAWITPESLTNAGLGLDIMTPHHSTYYTGPDLPTDFDDPTPIPFLSVTGAFTFALAITPDLRRDPQATGWLDIAATLVRETLQHSGVGGKTTSGYGRLV